MTLGDRLRIARERNNLNQLDVYRKTRINNKTISRFENNKNEPDITTLKILANLYNTSVSSLIGEKETDEIKLDEMLSFSSNLTWNDKEMTQDQIEKVKNIIEVILR